MAMERLTNCIVKIRDWMVSNRLKLNEDMTQVIWLGTRHQLSKLTENTLTLPNATVQFSTVFNDLGVQTDSQLSMSNHIANLSLYNSGWFDSLWRWRRWIHWCSPSSQIVWTPATVSWSASTVSCYRGCRWYRMPQLVSSLEPGGSSTWRQCYATFTGYRMSKDQVQDGHTGIQVSSWHGSTIPDIILHTGLCSNWTFQLAIRDNRPIRCAAY